MIARTLPLITTALLLSTTTGPALSSAAAAATCTSGWTGSVTYSRIQSANTSKTQDRVSGKGTETTNWTMNYNYNAQIAVRALRDPSAPNGVASIAMSSSSTETKAAKDRYICPHEKTAREMTGNFTSQSQVQANGGGLETDVSIGVDSDGRYSVGVRLPEIKGTLSGSTSSSFGGQCTARAGKRDSLSPTPTTVEGFSFSSSGNDRVDPTNPDSLNGSHSVSAYGVTERLQWSLRRCGGALRLVDLKFEDMRYPNWEAWKEIVEQTGTIDGNIVRITAVVANDGPEEKIATVKFRDTYKGDKWDGARPDGLLDELSVSIPSGEEREVQFAWDSSGYAWYDDGRARFIQRIKAEVEDAGKKVDEKTKNLKVAPKPLILVHGLWSNWQAWQPWQNILTMSHSYDWKAFPVGEKPQFGRMNTGNDVGNIGPTNTIAQNAEELERYIKYAQRDRNAWHVDIVAHSMGGLISRRYIHSAMPVMPDGKPLVAHLVMLGTPNMGSRCADLISIPLEADGRSMHALRELRPSVVAKFNALHTERKGVEFSVLAGNPLPTMCYMMEANDGVVAVSSALWTIADHAKKSVLHTNMANAAEFSFFVKPRIAIGPGKQTPKGRLSSLDAKPAMQSASLPGSAARLMLITGDDVDAAQSAGAQFARIVKVPAGQTVDLGLPVTAARNLGLTFVAPPMVSATLIDGRGAIAGASLSDTPEASHLFRSIFIDRPVLEGVWKLVLRNESQLEQEVVVAMWSNAR